MKKHHIIISFISIIGALTTSGCNLLTPLSTEFDTMCREAEQNHARANETYANKLINPVSGKFHLSELAGNYHAYIDVASLYYDVHYEIGTEGDAWKQYNEGQYVTSGERVVTGINVHNGVSSRKNFCIISTAPVPKK
ncbi:hypothetical protein [Ruminobacter sp.]|uniref:hypothetical protein n=1 Tax=Ruminobacter sp. TaxID=2774296 RepID=UPI003863EE0F